MRYTYHPLSHIDITAISQVWRREDINVSDLISTSTRDICAEVTQQVLGRLIEALIRSAIQHHIYLEQEGVLRKVAFVRAEEAVSYLKQRLVPSQFQDYNLQTLEQIAARINGYLRKAVELMNTLEPRPAPVIFGATGSTRACPGPDVPHCKRHRNNGH